MNRSARRKVRRALDKRAELMVVGGRIRASLRVSCGCSFSAEATSRAGALDALAEVVVDELNRRHQAEICA